MGRSYAQILLTIWNDPDFRGSSADAQWLYFVMLTHPSLSSCGVVDWRESRLAALAQDMTVQRIRNAAHELGMRRLIAVDADTEEALVRSFVRHDGILKSPNQTKKLVREHGGIASPLLLELVSRETRRAVEEDPSLKGKTIAEPVWKQYMDGEEPDPSGWVPEWFQTDLEGFQNGSNLVPERVSEGFQNGSDSVPFEIPQKGGNPSVLVSPPLTLNPNPTTEVVLGAANASTKKNDRRGSRISEGWKPKPETVATIRSEYPSLDLAHEHKLFIDYWLACPGQRGVKLDWEATWRGWMRRSGKRLAETPARQNQADGTDARVQGWLNVVNETPETDLDVTGGEYEN